MMVFSLSFPTNRLPIFWAACLVLKQSNVISRLAIIQAFCLSLPNNQRSCESYFFLLFLSSSLLPGWPRRQLLSNRLALDIRPAQTQIRFPPAAMEAEFGCTVDDLFEWAMENF
jgi:hypothetical protein